MLEDLVRSLRRGALNPLRRHRHAGLAVALIRGGEMRTMLDAGIDEIDDDTLFEVGSITKTMTGTLLAVLVGDGVLNLDTTVGDVLGGDAGRAAPVTLVELATHTAGLPRLAPNALEGADPKDPYAHFGPGELLRALSMVELGDKASVYSNFGFQLLGHVLSVAAGADYGRLVVNRVVLPAGCVRPRCGNEEPGDHRVPGYAGSKATPRWRQPLGGAGAVELGIADLARWMQANLEPHTTEIGEALLLAQQLHRGDRTKGAGLGWTAMNGGLWHNGGTGGFHAFGALVPGHAANAVLTNVGGWKAIDLVAMQHLTRAVK